MICPLRGVEGSSRGSAVHSPGSLHFSEKKQTLSPSCPAIPCAPSAGFCLSHQLEPLVSGINLLRCHHPRNSVEDPSFDSVFVIVFVFARFPPFPPTPPNHLSFVNSHFGEPFDAPHLRLIQSLPKVSWFSWKLGKYRPTTTLAACKSPRGFLPALHGRPFAREGTPWRTKL